MNKTKLSFLSNNKVSLCIALVLTILNIGIVFGLNLHHFSFEARQLTAFQIIFSASLYLLYILFCIFMWIKRYTKLAKGLFYYQLVGSTAYILYFIGFIFRAHFQELPCVDIGLRTDHGCTRTHFRNQSKISGSFMLSCSYPDHRKNSHRNPERYFL